MLLGTLCGCGGLLGSVISDGKIITSDYGTDYITKRLEENGYSETVYPRVTASTMKFTLTQEDVDLVIKKAEECEAVFKEGRFEDKEKLRKLLYETNSLLAYVDTQLDIAYMFYYSDMKSTKAEADYDFAYVAWVDASRKFYDVISLSDVTNNYLTPVLKEFDEKELRLYTVSGDYDQIVKARQEIVTRYGYIENPADESVEDEVFALYIEFVKNSHKLAKANNYVNYYRYMCDGDYSDADKEEFRKFVKEYVVPLCIDYSNGYKEFDATLSKGEYNLSLALSDGDYRIFNKDIFYTYFDSLGGNVGELMKEIFTEDKIVTPKGAGGYELAFNRTVGDTVLCYFPSVTKIDDIATQSAYYCAARLHEEMSDELSVLYAYSNMLLFIKSLEGKVNEKALQSYANYKLYNQLYQIIGCTVKDEFDEIIFNNSNPGNISLAEMERYMELLIKEYRVVEYGGERAAELLRTYWSRRGVYDSCSMFSGAVSMCAALDIYAEAVVDYKAATKTFCFIMENVFSRRDFIGTMSRAGIGSPFKEEFFVNIKERLAWK